MKINYYILTCISFITSALSAQIPILNSNPSISNKVIYLDFDGQKVSGTLWNNGATINASPSTVSAANMKLIWQRVSEDYRPFNVNITTDSVRFNNANPSSRIRVVFTPTSAWYGSAGGVAYLGSFTWGGYPGTPCWIFENQLGYSSKNMAEAASHEAGHTLSLMHQSTYNNSTSTCSKTAEYNPGQGSGVTSWAPIMGVGYSKNVTLWHNGTNASSCTFYQTDHSNSAPGITGPNYLSYLPDDVGDTYATSKILNLNNLTLADSGLITTPADLDVYQFTICNSRYVSVNVRPWALDSTAGSYQGANLDVKLKLYNSSNQLIASDTSISKLNSLIGLTLAPGSYYFSIDGGGSAYYSDYGSLGKYYVNVKATNPPQLANTILTPANLCAGQITTLTYSSNGTPSIWQWTITGPSSATSAVANPSFNFSTAGIYTITLLATSSVSTSCATTNTYNVGSAPNLSIAGTNTVLCPQKSGFLSVTGATSYTWLPGNFTGTALIVNPLSTTIYTVLGSNGTCSNSVSATLSVNPQFTLTVAASNSTICAGSSVSLTASGAGSYTFYPGFVSTNPAVYTPTYNTNYTVTGNSNGCLKTAFALINVIPPFYFTVFASDTVICAGQPIILNASGANNYTFNPGGMSGNVVTVSPTVATIYTVTASDANQCLADTTIEIIITNCVWVGNKQIPAAKQLVVYPNPASNQLYIECNESNYRLSVFDALGKLIYLQLAEQQQKITINTSQWPKGIYYVRIDEAGKPLGGEKILIR